MLKIGEVIRVMDHDLEGLKWTIGQVGYVKFQVHGDFDANYPGGKVNVPDVKEGYIVSLGHARAKNGYAYATLSERLLPPHACTERCEVHKGLLG